MPTKEETTNVQAQADPQPEVQNEKLANDIATEFYKTGRVRSGYALRFESRSGGTVPVITKADGK